MNNRICSTAFCVLRSNPNKIDPSFLFYAVSYGDFVDRVSEHQRGVAYPAITDKEILEESIPLPPLPEQHAIATTLRTVQEAKEKTDAVIAATKALKASMMKHLFMYGPVPPKDVERVALRETEIGPVPDAWEIRQLSSLFDIKHGYSFKSEFFGSTGKFILLTPGHFHEEGGFKDLKEKTKFYTIEPPHDLILTKGDLLVAMTEQSPGLLGSPIFIPESDKYLHNQRLGLIQNLDTTNLIPEYLFHFFNLEKVRTIISITSTGTKVKHTSPNKIRAIPISLPTIDEQKKTVTILSSIDQKLAAEQSRKEALDTLFTSLLHDLMTAKIRINPIAV